MNHKNNKTCDVYTVNLEAGMPTVAEAMQHFEFALSMAKSRKYKTLKLIHGYGSSGTGGKIKQSVQKRLTLMKKAGVISDFIKGEEFSPFESTAQKYIIKYNELIHDSDYLKCNHGITIIIL